MVLSFLDNAVFHTDSVVDLILMYLLERFKWEYIRLVRDAKGIWSCCLKSGIFLSLFSCCSFVSPGRAISSRVDRGSE